VLSAFWSGLGGELAKQWAARIVTPALAFWFGGLAAVWWHAHGDAVDANGWAAELERTIEPLRELPAVAQGLLVVGGLVLIAASALVAERLTLPLLRFLEGYWPAMVRARSPSRRRRRRHDAERRNKELLLKQRRGGLDISEYAELRRLERSPGDQADKLAGLQAKRASGFTPRDAAELFRVRTLLRDTPSEDSLAMPTRLGDILRAAERRPLEKYGLDAVICWTALWLVMPVDARTEIAQTRARLDAALRFWLWGALFVVWTPWTPLALPVAIAAPLLAYYGGILAAARLFGELVVTGFDLYRMSLYDALHLPRPASPADERRHGAQVTNLLWGGLDDPSVTYVP
jgi:hypothetical protein